MKRYYVCNYCGTEFQEMPKWTYQETVCPKCGDKKVTDITHKIEKIDVYSDKPQKDAWVKKR